MAVIVDVDECVGCGSCEEACENGAIVVNEESIAVVDGELCDECATCVDECAVEAISVPA